MYIFGESGEFISVELWTSLFTLVNLLILFFIMKKLLFKPVKAMIDSRQKEIDDLYADANASKEDAAALKAKYEQRLDLKLCGRTLFGARPPKGQEMEDHYCGRIRLRVRQFMRDLDEALWELGVPAKTEHNEAAPAQHELAPVFGA
ncbi:MAG: hypothetical protein ACI4QO_06370, partial [Clostridia bacterium]